MSCLKSSSLFFWTVDILEQFFNCHSSTAQIPSFFNIIKQLIMSQVVREDIDNLNAVLTVTVAQETYEPKFNQQLSKHKQQAHMKGFRKGKTPTSVIKKMFGKGILADIVNEAIQESLLEYIKGENLDILGQPIPSDKQEEIEFDLKDLKDYVFKFEIGVTPDFEIQGMDSDQTFEKYKVTAKQEDITEEIEKARKQLGDMIHSEGEITEADLVKFGAQEMDGDAIKADGIEAEFSVPVDKMTEAAKATILAASVGDTLDYDVSQLEIDVTPEYVKKHYLNQEGDADINLTFHLTIKDATHVAPAELNEEFFVKLFGNDEITSEEEARAAIAKNIEDYYDQQADALLFRDFQDRLLELNDVSLPDTFLKKWLLLSNEKATETDIEGEYASFAKNLQWSLITDKIAKKAGIEMTEDELKAGLARRVMGYLQGNPGLGEEFIEMMVGRLMQDEQQVNQVRDEIMSEKLHDVIAEQVTIKDKAIEADAFLDLMREARAAAEKSRGQVAAPAEEEE
jgi:trigger factor